ncbi:MAG: oligopeptide/dipeptide transporter, ATPase subunit, partial [Paenibacillus sp.]|nr:oligopeptide/dipeptide transporter, ATPase subunit [Paenibacillus sp.]
MPLLEVDGLSVSFTQLTRGFRETRLIALQDVGLDVDRSEIVAVIGASGSGKSLLAHAVLGILPGNAAMSGSIRFDGKPLTTSRQEELRGRSISLIPQSVNFLDPLMRVGSQVRHSVKSGDPAAAQRSAFERFRLPAAAAKLYPHQLSGGMARRVLVATATVSGAELLIADEPTPGLDPAIMQEALATLRELADQGAAVLLISHDLDSALRVADRVAVLYAGTTVEVAP